MALNIAVCMKVVPNPDQYDRIKLDPVKKTLIRAGVDSVINSADLHAIELALQLKAKFGGKVTLLSMGPNSIEPQLREGLSYGCDEAVLLSDRKFGGADSLATSYTLSQAVQKLGGFDLILLGNASEDGATAHVPSQLGELLNLPHITDVSACEPDDETCVRVKKEVGGEIYEFRVHLPAVLGVTRRINQVRHPSVMGIFGAKKKPLTVLTAADFDGIEESRLGLSGSPTQAGDYRDVAYDRSCKELGSMSELLKVINMARG